MRNNNSSIWLIGLLILFSFIVRAIPFNFPEFTSEEAKIAYRGHALGKTGKDELGRSFPILFNSLNDYQLPAVSYLTASGELLFGKSDLGVRIPFVSIGIALVLLVYKITQFFSKNTYFWFISTFAVAFSPSLIFLSKVPNETILLTFIFTLLFYLLIKKKSIFSIILTMLFAVIISKQAWFILPPFSFFTIFFYQKSWGMKKKLTIITFSLMLSLAAFILFLTVPQAKRSLSENNFSIFTNITIKNGINRLRGQGIESGWPQSLDRILFNKIYFIIIGFLHWLSNISPATYFGQFDINGKLNFSQAGVLTKVLIIPFVGGLIYLIRKGKDQERLLLAFLIILTFPAMFIYPNFSQDLVNLTAPFIVLIVAFGFTQFKRQILLLIILAVVLELGLNLSNLTPEKEVNNSQRPYWVKKIVQDVYKESTTYKTAVSDDIVNDIVAFIEWYNPIDIQTAYLDIPYPYKFRQTILKNIKIIGSDNELYSCKKEEYEKLFISKRDKDKIKDSTIQTVKTYQDSLDQDVVYLLAKGLCIK